MDAKAQRKDGAEYSSAMLLEIAADMFRERGIAHTTMRNIAGRAALAASLGQGLLAAGGYARVPRGDGLLKLADLGRLSAAEAKACWMYRQLHVSEEGTTAKLTAAIDGLPKASGGDIALSATVRHHETTTLAYLVQVVRSKVGDEALMILNAVARDGLLLRSVTGGGKAWERGLGRLKQAAAVVATHLAD